MIAIDHSTSTECALIFKLNWYRYAEL